MDEKQKRRLTHAFIASKSALTRFLAGFFVNKEDIEDTLQDTYANVLAALVERKAEVDEPQAYLFRVARNIALNRIKRQHIVVMETVGNFDESIVDIQLEQTSAVDAQYRKDQLNALLLAVDTLPAQCRRVFVMQRIQGMSYKAIARKLGISTRTVEKHLEKALYRCAEQLSAQGFADDNVASIDKYLSRKA
jgi:RNA polymerase sigma factor (sigma-70 family)